MNPTGKLIALKSPQPLELRPEILSRIGASNQVAIGDNVFVVRTSQTVEEIYGELENEFDDAVGILVCRLRRPGKGRGDIQAALKAMELADQP